MILKKYYTRVYPVCSSVNAASLVSNLRRKRTYVLHLGKYRILRGAPRENIFFREPESACVRYYPKENPVYFPWGANLARVNTIYGAANICSICCLRGIYIPTLLLCCGIQHGVLRDNTFQR